ncbi:MAG: Bacterial regulatory helix-turn-helix protein lysR family, partial [Acetobacteraceae bacterium]|nr:Bacterial regulatory helix-turn-helix protein lysR family [Acetobacteraceae bacterium]
MSKPSFRALRAFAETSRTGSLAAASRVLNVTPSAISHLLRELEQSLAL